MELLVDISKKFEGFELAVSLEVNNETLGFLGASGSGKSLTLRGIAGLITPSRGRIILNDRVLFDSERGINLPAQKRSVGFLFQNYALFPHLTVAQNIAFGLQKLPKKEQVRRVEEKLTMTQLEGLGSKYPYQLSGGQQQRTALARALAIEPDVLLLDEPLSALDNHLRSQMEKELIETLSNYKGITIFVTHNLEECYRVCDKIAVMEAGQAVTCGSKEDIFLNPQKVSIARLTGCKNISKCKAVSSSNAVMAADWGCSLDVDQPVSPQSTHIGIRAHQIHFVKDLSLKNTFPCWVADVAETPYQTTLYLSLNTPPANSNQYHIQVKLNKDKYLDSLKQRPLPWLVHLAPEYLFLMKD